MTPEQKKLAETAIDYVYDVDAGNSSEASFKALEQAAREFAEKEEK